MRASLSNLGRSWWCGASARLEPDFSCSLGGGSPDPQRTPSSAFDKPLLTLLLLATLLALGRQRCLIFSGPSS